MTLRHITRMYKSLDYTSLGSIYCEEGGEAFWEDRREPCRKMGVTIAKALRTRLSQNGRSLYVGAGVAEIPPLVMEQVECSRTVLPYNLRQEEVAILNQASTESGISFLCDSPESATGSFDHLWIVSVLNDPESFPNVSALAYGRADPLTFDIHAFIREREVGFRLVDHCMRKLTLPAIVTTSVEEIQWIACWCQKHQIVHEVENRTYPTALVGDPLCFLRIG